MDEGRLMKMNRAAFWLFIVAGTLWMLAGLRDLFAPGFFSINGRVVTGSSIALDFAIGAVFLILSHGIARRSRDQTRN